MLLYRIAGLLEKIFKGDSSREGWGHISMMFPAKDWSTSEQSHAAGFRINQQSGTCHQGPSQSRTMKCCVAAFYKRQKPHSGANG